MKVHPLATLFSEMSAAEFAALKADIDKHGVRERVWTWRGSVIDGRHRYRACEELGLECPSQEFAGSEDELPAFVISQSIRANRTESERAMAAAKLANMKRGEHKSESNSAIALSQTDASTMLDVSVDSVKRAAKVIAKAAPEVVAAVERGRMSVSLASKVADLPADTQRAVASAGRPRSAAKVALAGGDPDEKRAAEGARDEPAESPGGTRVGMRIANDAIDVMRKIPHDDGLRDQAYKFVINTITSWLKKSR